MEKEIKLKIAYNRGEIELLKNQITELKQGYVKCLRQHIYRQGGIIIPIDADYDQDLVDIITELYWDKFDEEIRELNRIR